MVSRIQFQDLARTYSIDCEILLREGRWSSAYYLAGYVVECAVKACLLRSIPAGSLPTLHVSRTFYSHNLEELLKAAKLEPELRQQPQLFRDRWNLILGWKSESRFDVL